MTTSRGRVALLSLLFALTACGGGGGGSGTNVTPVTGDSGAGGNTPTPAPSPAPAPASAPSASAAQQVNATTAGDQHDPRIARLASGGFVIAWQSPGGVNAQVFDAAGQKSGGEIAVFQNLALGGLAGLPDGSFIVSATKSMIGTGGPQQWVYAQRVSPGGQLVATGGVAAADVNGGAASLVMTQTGFDVSEIGGPILVRRDGSYSVSFWSIASQPNGASPVKFQNFDAQGRPTGSPWSPASTVAADDMGQFANGNIIVAWTSGGQAGSTRWAVSTASGQEIVEGGLTTMPAVTLDVSPRLAVLADDTAVLVSSYAQFQQNIREWNARRLDSSGAQVGTEIALPVPADANVRVAALAGGGFVATWTTTAGALFARMFGVDMHPAGDAMQLSATTGAPVQSSAAQGRVFDAAAVAGGFAVTYQAPGADANEIYEVRVTTP
jgi:hypothetical protein